MWTELFLKSTNHQKFFQFLITISAFIFIIGTDSVILEEAMAFTLTSPGFSHNNEIPAKYTCQGEDISPPLEWKGVPQGTRSLALIVDDPDAPDPKAPQLTWVHWVVYNLPPDINVLSEGMVSADLPKGAKPGMNDWKKNEYGGPCPPIGRHRYFHKLYALDAVLSGIQNPSKADLEAAMEGHIIEKTELVGTYEKTEQ